MASSNLEWLSKIFNDTNFTKRRAVSLRQLSFLWGMTIVEHSSLKDTLRCWRQDLANLGVEKLCIMTDKNVVDLPGMKTIIDSLHSSRIKFDVYSDVCIEPTDKRYKYCVNVNKVFFSVQYAQHGLSEIKRDVGRKSGFFNTPSHSTPRLWGCPSEYCHPVWCGKTSMVGLRGYVYNRLETILACDRLTDILRRQDAR